MWYTYSNDKLIISILTIVDTLNCSIFIIGLDFVIVKQHFFYNYQKIYIIYYYYKNHTNQTQHNTRKENMLFTI